MEKKIIEIFYLLSILFFIPSVLAVSGQLVGTWYGYVLFNNTQATNETVLTVYYNTSSVVALNTSVGEVLSTKLCQLSNCTGFYYVDIETNGVTGNNISFKVCGINVSQQQVWTSGIHYSILNLSVNKSADDAACTYACGCLGGYCCSNLCKSSACPVAATTTTTAAPSAGGGGAVSPETTTTTTPPVKEIETVASISAGGTGTFSFETVPIVDIKVDVKNAVNNVQLTVTKTDTAPATVAIAAPGVTYGYFNIEKTNIGDVDISKVTIKFKVEKSWITNNNIDVGTITLNKYLAGTWTPLTTKLTSSDGYYYFEAESSTLSVFAVNAQKKAVTTTIPATTTVPTTTIPTTTTVPIVPPVLPPTTLYIIIGIILIVVVVIFFVRKPRKLAKTSSAT